MKIDFNKNVIQFPRLYSGVVRQQGRVTLDADFQETRNAASGSELQETTRGDSPAVFAFGERVLLAQLQKAELNSRCARLHGTAVGAGLDSKGNVEPALVDSREDVRRHRERLGNLLAKLHGESPSPNRETILKHIRPALADLSRATEKNISLLTGFKTELEKLRSGADSPLERTIAAIVMEIKENQEQLHNSWECVRP